MDIQELFSENLDALRRKSGLSYRKFADRISVSKTTLQDIVSKRQKASRLDTLQTIAEGTGIPPAFLLTDLPQILEFPCCPMACVTSLAVLFRYLSPAEQRQLLRLLAAFEPQAFRDIGIGGL